MKGYLHVYTGNGKGKSTAAFGLALRAAGAGKRVYIAQFVKGRNYSEITAIREHLLKRRAPGCEMVVTGRYAPDDLIELADLVTEMREVKHYYRRGIEAREGIEY